MAGENPSTARENLNWTLSLLLALVTLVVPTLLCGLLYLSRVPDVTWQRGDLTYDRVWLARTRRPVGVALESQRVKLEYSEREVCVESHVRFFLWNRSPNLAGQNVVYNQIMVLTDAGWQASGQACR